MPTSAQPNSKFRDFVVLPSLLLAIWLFLVSGSLTTTGMFMDGLIYSNVAANLAEGTGSFWHLTYTASHHPAFYEHPPLMMGLLALFYKVFGVHLWVTKLYMAVSMLLCAWLTLLLWSRLGGKKENGWIPLLFWTLMPVVTHFANECMLENTMLLFDLGAILLILPHQPISATNPNSWPSQAAKPITKFIISGFLLSAAFLTKGFVGLFPLVLPLLIWLFDRERLSTKSMLLQTSSLLVGLLLPLAVIALSVPAAREYFVNYMDHQVLAAWSQNEDARWMVIVYFLRNIAIVVGLVLVVALLKKGLKHKPSSLEWTLWALVACAVLPMMVSTRQNEYYILPAMPIVAVLAALLVEGEVSGWIKKVNKALPYISFSMLVGALLLNIFRFGSEGRDRLLQQDLKLIAAHLEKGERVSIPSELYYNYKLQGYYYRDLRVTLDDQQRCRHFLTTDEYQPDSSYHPLNLLTKEYRLYEINDL
ncbi:MAG: glycosyltransferase family 39 protein [Bacteroidales bacterium]|nr:glycosyltransferase family 39 protein [Bacteroidales bacterium]